MALDMSLIHCRDREGEYAKGERRKVSSPRPKPSLPQWLFSFSGRRAPAADIERGVPLRSIYR
jgi:hypothetical protein